MQSYPLGNEATNSVILLLQFNKTQDTGWVVSVAGS